MKVHDYLLGLISVLSKFERDSTQLQAGIDMIERAWHRGAQIITCGNGGSGHVAAHYITDWNKFISTKDKPFRGRCLLDNFGTLTGDANDHGFSSIFELQLHYVARPGDLLIAISGSGTSENVLRAVSYARGFGCETLGICGFNGGALKRAVHRAIHVPIADMQLAEDVFAIFGHIVMRCRDV